MMYILSHIVANCLTCQHMHKLNDKERFFCLEKRDYILHEIDEPIECEKYRPTANRGGRDLSD